MEQLGVDLQAVPLGTDVEGVANQTMTYRSINISLNLTEQLVVTQFADGSQAHACPHDTDEYRAHAQSKG